MNKTYQPFIINMANDFVKILNDLKFFEEEHIKSKDFTHQLICNELTNKFLCGLISEGDVIEGIFNEEEFNDILLKTITNSTLEGLIEKGLINYFYDDNGEEAFFLTADGKEVAKKLVDNENKIDSNE